jgi:hypothetical protein
MTGLPRQARDKTQGKLIQKRWRFVSSRLVSSRLVSFSHPGVRAQRLGYPHQHNRMDHRDIQEQGRAVVCIPGKKTGFLSHLYI